MEFLGGVVGTTATALLAIFGVFQVILRLMAGPREEIRAGLRRAEELFEEGRWERREVGAMQWDYDHRHAPLAEVWNRSHWPFRGALQDISYGVLEMHQVDDPKRRQGIAQDGVLRVHQVRDWLDLCERWIIGK